MADYRIQCSHCGQFFDMDDFKGNTPVAMKMRAAHLCFSCAFWDNILKSHIQNNIVVSGKLYIFHPIKLRKLSKRNIGKQKLMYVYRLSDRSIFASNNFRYIGTIPKSFTTEFPDEYKEISQDTFFRIQNYEGTECTAKGCFDRYNCLWYNPETSEPDGPWNIIPPSYQIGDEECESFINKEQIFKQ